MLPNAKREDVTLPIIDPLTNRLVVTGTNYAYDRAGNLTQEPVGTNLQTYAYDAEGRLAKVNNTAGVYTYDGEGRRVKKTDGASTTVFVYNAMGQMVAEYSNTAPSGRCAGVTHLKVVSRGKTPPSAQPSILCVSPRPRVSRFPASSNNLIFHRPGRAITAAAPVLSSQRLRVPRTRSVTHPD
jgi:YD repeat-containing protein